MSSTDNLIGLLPTVITGGIALKFTQAALGKKKRVSYPARRGGKRLSKKYSPW